MAGGARLGFGYTLLAIGVLLGLVGGVLAGSSFSASASEEECHDGGLLGPDHCERNEASVDGEAIGIGLLIPGLLLIVVAVPLVVSGHNARDEPTKAANVEVNVDGQR